MMSNTDLTDKELGELANVLNENRSNSPSSSTTTLSEMQMLYGQQEVILKELKLMGSTMTTMEQILIRMTNNAPHHGTEPPQQGEGPLQDVNNNDNILNNNNSNNNNIITKNVNNNSELTDMEVDNPSVDETTLPFCIVKDRTLRGDLKDNDYRKTVLKLKIPPLKEGSSNQQLSNWLVQIPTCTVWTGSGRRLRLPEYPQFTTGFLDSSVYYHFIVNATKVKGMTWNRFLASFYKTHYNKQEKRENQSLFDNYYMEPGDTVQNFGLYQ